MIRITFVTNPAPSNRAASKISFGIASIAAPLVYFALSNFMVWIEGAGYVRPKTFSGLMQTYVDGLPFLSGSIMSSVVFSIILFGGYYLLTILGFISGSFLTVRLSHSLSSHGLVILGGLLLAGGGPGLRGARFPGLRMAWDALRAPFGSCAVMNAANEVAVQAFLDERIRFTDIHRVNSATLNAMSFAAPQNLDDLLALDAAARSLAEQQLKYCPVAA